MILIGIAVCGLCAPLTGHCGERSDFPAEWESSEGWTARDGGVEGGRDAWLLSPAPLAPPYEVSLEIQTIEKGDNPWNTAQIRLGYQDDGNFISLLFDAYGGANLSRRTGGKTVRIERTDGGASWKALNRVRLVVQTNRLEIWANRSPLLTVPGLRVPDGRVGLSANQSQKVFFRACRISPIQDSVRLRPGSLFTEHAVLQRDRPIRVWGFAPEGASVRVSLDSDTREAPVHAGRFEAVFPARPAGGPYRLTFESETDRVMFTNILVGEVWLCSGQSNMQWPLWHTSEWEADRAQVKNPLLRLAYVPRTTAEEPQTLAPGAEWVVADEGNAAAFSAVAYYMGAYLQRALRVPVGMIMSAYGGSPIESWMSADLNRSEAEFAEAAEKRRQKSDEREQHLPSSLHNAMIRPLIGYGLRGFTWYQGEANAWQPSLYARQLPALMREWRTAWGDPTLPFLIVQLAPYNPAQATQPIWAEFRDVQRAVSEADPYSGLVVTLDVGNCDDIHPKSKKPVGERLARLALARTYGRSLPHQGPRLQSGRLDGSAAVLIFDPGAERLMAGPHDRVAGFAAADYAGVFRPAMATVSSSNEVRVNIPEGRSPVRIRYAWENCPAGDLANDAGLPAAPFQTELAR